MNPSPRMLAAAALLAFCFFSRPAHANTCAGGYVQVCTACAVKSIKTAAQNIPGTPLTGDYCIDVTDNRVYDEQVTVVNKNTNNFQIIIGTDTGAGRPMINPPTGSTAAFQIINTSVTIENINIVTTNSFVNFGIVVSSDRVTISSVNIDDGGKVTLAGISLNNAYNDAILYSSITIGGPAFLSNIFIQGFGGHHTIAYSTAVPGTTGPANTVFTSNSSNNVYDHDFFRGCEAMQLEDSFSTISFSTAISVGCVIPPAIALSGNGNTVTQSYLEGTSGVGIPQTAANNTISFSTIAAIFSGGYGVDVQGTSTTVNNCTISASSGVIIDGSTVTILNSNTIIALGSNVDSYGIRMLDNSANLFLSSNTITGGPQSAGIYLDLGNAGNIWLVNNTISGGKTGIFISTMVCGGTCSENNLSISTMIFSGGLTAGATAIYFAGGTFVSTFTGIQFNDANIAVDVNGAPLAAGSRVTMNNYTGIRSGPSFEHDPTGLIDWTSAVPGNIPPSSPAIGQLMISSITVTFGAVAADAYTAQASTASNFTGNISSAGSIAATSLTITGLISNTTYYLRAGAVWGSTTFYANTTPASAITLAASPFPLTFSNIQALQFTANWSANGNPVNTNYIVNVSTDINFGIMTATAATTALTATFTGLTANATYFVRVEAVNSGGVASAFANGVVITTPGLITISANRLLETSGKWYSDPSAIFNAQGAPSYYYRVSTNPNDTPGPPAADPTFDGSSLQASLPEGNVYFHVTAIGGPANGTSAHFGPIGVDTGAPVMISIAGQNSASDTTPILNGGSTLSTTPRFTWPAAASFSPVQGYSLSLSTDPAVIPALPITTTILFSDQILSRSGTYYAKVSALNLAGTLGPPVSLTFTFTTIPSVSQLMLRHNYLNPLRGECAQLQINTATAGHLKAEVYTLLGQRVISLANDDEVPGVFNYSWCGKNSAGELVATGIYILHVETPQQKKNFKVELVK